MKIDIEKLNRKTPYPEPSEDFFKQMQANVISQTMGKNPVVVKKETKVFALDFKWMAAAAVVLIAGLTAFFGFNHDPEVTMAQQAPIVDSVYKIEQPANETSADLIAKNDVPTEVQHETSKSKQLKTTSAIASSNTKTVTSSDRIITDRQDYAVGTNKKSELDVEKVLAAFTPDQLKDIDRNSEQDVYLDLYN
ncbi:hypothetical protein [Epilithonimonas lactis]|uniref:Uncharacterized protein n=1 Tax=Epilithonimonas lactis TaxID=421072 RepID=A0A085BN78_9FLAO|nr:hypothetical protein [Epilithonimonas lactis]KFC23923.1 hypothetical protein IO89_05020 [Epilithonimonas lactis]SEQ30353.1 hypothetical protein SAMN04488097_1980 [Epilithonimonas lactis]